MRMMNEFTQHSFLNINKERENEIVGMGNMAKAHYDKRMIILNNEQKEIELHNKTNLNLPKHDIFSISINDKIFKSIVDDINKLFNLKCIEEEKKENDKDIKDS